MHAVRTQCKVWYIGKYSNPSFGPLPQVFGSIPGFFVFLCIGVVVYLNCHPFLPICNPFSIPIFSPPWEPREGGHYVTILIYPHHGDPKKAGVMGDPEKVGVM